MTAPQYYNEFDPYEAQWLRNLIAAGHLPPGDVDERSIVDIHPEDLNGYGQCHFFAGIGVWPYALGRNGWRERDSLWSGSCPCQPFSAAGQQLGFNDERHLWPAWFHLITQRRPSIVVGEQVASALPWLDLVSDDLESAGYAVGAADLCAAGFPVENWSESPQHEWLLRALYDCPDPVVAAELLDFAAFAGGNLGAHDGDHIRQRLYFVGLAEPDGWERDGQPSGEGCERNGPSTGRHESDGRPQPGGAVSGMAYANGGDASEGRAIGLGQQRFQSSDNGDGRGRGGGAQLDAIGLVDPSRDGRREKRADDRGGRTGNREEERAAGFESGGDSSRLADDGRGGREMADLDDRGGRTSGSERQTGEPRGRGAIGGGATHALDERRGAADWLFCRDGKWRAVGPGAFPLANAPAARVGRLRAYGNALDAETVVAFLASVRECAP